MLINKMGSQHLEYGINCQDFGAINKNGLILSSYHGNKVIRSDVKIVCDGCSAGLHSEVGAKAFIHLMAHNSYDTRTVFTILNSAFGQTPQDKKDYLSFTILYAFDDDDAFAVSNCGDGYCITQRKNGDIEFLQFDCGEYPEYFVYNYIHPKYLQHYKEGVQFHDNRFPKDEYERVGVASDGIRFVFDQDEEFQQKFKDLLRNDKESGMKRFINMNQKVFKDDVTIAF